ncbi:MAG: glutamate--tRNA ligase [Ignavibacteria bacterium]|nr:glutamate--tRNA ligase [Ignavibacteria bacterium]
MKEVRVRFAPSPTGFLHVGGARTAIFNWLFAKNKGGKFLLRIEDTDPERSKSELSAQILRSMEWLGMTADEEIVYQALNINRHKKVVNELIGLGKAYYAFETQEELDQMRKDAKAKKQQYKYNRASLDLNTETIKKYLAEGKPYAIRFKVPDGSTEFIDIVHGKTVFNNSEIEDFVILRSDGSPVYQIAVVVDDHDMKISHVIRGDDHLSNTPKQILLYNALGWEVPDFAHLPMILDEQKKKLSKRRNPVSVEEYKKKGYLAEALFNFLTLLGFAPEGNKEIFSKKETTKEFTFERVNKSSAVFDMKKLGWINSEYLKLADPIILSGLVRNKILELKLPEVDDTTRLNIEYLCKVISLMKERVSTINDFVEFGRYFFTAPVTFEENGLQKHWNQKIRTVFLRYFDDLNEISNWEIEILEDHLRKFAEANNVKAGELIHVLRLSLTGITISPGIFDLMSILDKETVIKRIGYFLNRVQEFKF